MQFDQDRTAGGQLQPASARFEAVGRHAPSQGVVDSPSFLLPLLRATECPDYRLPKRCPGETLHRLLDSEMVFRTGSADGRLRATALHTADNLPSSGQHALDPTEHDKSCSMC